MPVVNGKPTKKRGSRLKSPGSAKVECGSMTDIMKFISGVEWLVPKWVPKGMLTLVFAEPGVGKSTFVLTGLIKPLVSDERLPWFDGLGDSFPGFDGPQNVLLCDTESNASPTIEAIKRWRINPEYIKTPYKSDPLKIISLESEADLLQIENAITSYSIPLVVIDSLRGANGQDENQSKISKCLTMLSKVAERTNAAIVVVHHTGKIPYGESLKANSSRGSNAIVATVRCQIGLEKHCQDVKDFTDEEREEILIKVFKENLGNKPEPMGMRIRNSGVTFCVPLVRPSGKQKETRKDQAKNWLQKRLRPGEVVWAREIREEAEVLGFSKNALQRAKEDLGIVAKKKKEGWAWSVPVAKRLARSNKTAATGQGKKLTSRV